MGNQPLTYHAYNEKSVLISWNEKTKEIIEKRSNVAQQISQLFKNEVTINHGAYSILVLWRDAIDHQKMIAFMDQNLKTKKLQDTTSSSWRLPIFYDIEPQVLEQLQMDAAQIITIHSSCVFQVDFIGFLPGFPYLKGLHKSLHIPRKSTPVLQVAAGSVTVANEYCGIYPSQSPAGWHVLGRCPLPIFNKEKEPAALLKSGDRVVFFEIALQEFEQIEVQSKAGNLHLQKFKIHA